MTAPPPRIHRLPPEVVARIAAGEVIERPASVAKELIENSLDAGAARVVIEVEGGPDQRLVVADDGHGMDEENLRLALERHATSKIDSAADLFRVTTLGFRGEGLASIAAVSRLSISTSTADGPGVRALVEGGEIVELSIDGRSRGTTVEVRDLFFNTPARRKFQRATSTELQQVARTLQSYALVRPDLHVIYVVGGREILNLPGAASFHDRMIAIYGADRVARMIPVSRPGTPIGIEGFLGAPEDSRARSDHQTFFVNGRWVSNPLLRQAVRQAYGNLIPFDRHPFAIVSIAVDPARVDVNVHPTKKEVRFSNDRDLFPSLVSALKRAVEAHAPRLDLSGGGRLLAGAPSPGEGGVADLSAVGDMADLFGAAYAADAIGRASSDTNDVGRESAARAGEVHDAERDGPEGGADGLNPEGDLERELPSNITPLWSPGRPGAGGPGALIEPARADLWQLHRTYILAAVKGALLIVDQHAAHERVLFEEAILKLRKGRGAGQELLFPQVVGLTAEEFLALLDVQPTLEKLGFHLELFGGTTVVVHGIPAAILDRWHDGALLREMLSLYGDLPPGPPIEERVARSYACRAAVKAGEPLDAVSMNELLDRLFATTLPQGDPHGRPTFLKIPIEDLHRRFGRSG